MTESPLPFPSLPSVPRGSHRNRNIGIVALVIGLVIGLALGMFTGLILLPTHTGAGTNNQVQVSGTVSETQSGTITFIGLNKTNPILSSALITNGKYSILLVGGQSYAVEVSYTGSYGIYFTIYIPLGVNTFPANF